jgi:glycine/D-amino acid oxidase-like deaminating enzyme
MNILILGAGLLGASLAYRLTQAGCTVTVAEARAPASGASGSSFGWINASFYLNPAHHRLRVAAIAAHHRLTTDLALPAPTWSGTLWFETQGEPLARLLSDLTTLNYPVTLIPNPAALEPALLTPPPQALHFPTEGATEATTLTHALLAASSAILLPQTQATALLTHNGRITGAHTAAGPLRADHTILAAGTGSPMLLQSIGLDLPLVHRPGLILRTHPVPFRLRHILVTPHQEIRQLPDGSLLTPCAANHQADTSEYIPDTALDDSLARLTALLGPVTPAETRRALRPVPKDGLPVLGQAAPGLSLAVMHSGVTLAPLAAEALTAEITGHPTHPLWLPYRPQMQTTPAKGTGSRQQT